MAIILNDNVDTRAPKPTDNRFGPYTTTAAALAGIPEYQRYVGLTVGVGTPIVEWWFDSTLTLVLKTTSGTVTGITAGTGISITGTVNPTISVTTPTQLTTNISTDVIADQASDTKYPSVKATKAYVDANVAGLLDDRGNFAASPSPGNYPTTGGSGPAGAIVKGDIWFISVPGFLNTTEVGIGASVRALVDNPGVLTDADWDILDTGLGFIPENVANKVLSGSSITSDPNSETKYASLRALTEYLASIPASTPTLEQVLAVTPGQLASGYDINLESLDTNLTTNVGRGEFSVTNVSAGTSVTAVDDTITIASVNDEVVVASDMIEFTNDTLGTLTITAVPNNNTLVLPNQNATLIASVNSSIFADSLTGDITIPYVGGSGTINYVPKWSASTTLADSQIFDNGTNVGVGTITPQYKLDVDGIINGTAINLQNGVQTGIYGGANKFDFWAGNNKIATWSLASPGETLYNHFMGWVYDATATGTSSAFRIASSLVSTGANGAGLTQLLIDPLYSQQTFGTGTLRGVYYNPSGGLNTSPHIAFENTSGNVLLGTTSGRVGVATSTPNAATKLDVNGNCHIGTGSPSIYIGAGHTMEITATYPSVPLTTIGGSSIIEVWSDATKSNGAVSYGASYPGAIPDGNIHFATFQTGDQSWRDRIIVEKNEGRVRIGVGNATAVASALLEVNSTTKGFLPPKMTTAQMNAIVSPVEGLIVYSTDAHALGVYTDLGWRKLSTEAF